MVGRNHAGMARRRLQASLRSFGIYAGWPGRHDQIPEIRQFTTSVPATVGIEFGFVLHLRDGRGEVLDWVIQHPPFTDEAGKRMKPFEGEFHVRTNDFEFYLGDSIWEPWQDKCGAWTLITSWRGTELARKTFHVVDPAGLPDPGTR